MLTETMNRLGLQGEKFDRWRHLQKLLDDETDPVDTNRLVCGVLERYYSNAKKKKVSSSTSDDEQDGIDTSPERTTERLLAIEKILQEYSSPLDQSLRVISSSSSSSVPSSLTAFNEKDSNDDDDSSVLLSTAANASTTRISASNNNFPSPLQQALMDILPHPVNEVDEHKGTWDTVMELHGREGVRIEEQTLNNPSWKERCLAARVLIYYDFLDCAEDS
jgi:hypothetical protein